MRLKSYLLDRIFAWVCLAAAVLFSSLLLWLADVQGILILFAEGIFLGTALAVSAWDFLRRRGFYRRLLLLSDQLEEKTLLAEIAEEPQFLDGQILMEILHRNSKYENDRIAGMERQNREYREYLDSWVHEIKTPITSAGLMIENDKNRTTLRIGDELGKIDALVEQVLYYARSTEAEKDFKVEKTTLREIAALALKAYSRPLIQSGAKIHMEELDIPVNADVKSCSFVAGQIISNAVKYRKPGTEEKLQEFHLTFSGRQEKNEVLLMIRDNGIGIPQADISRIFDKGFTGENGRKYTKSTGIGLYLCRKLCGQMNIRITAESVPGEGTEITLGFPAESMIREAGL